MTLPNLKPIIYKLFFSQTPKLPRGEKEVNGLYDRRGMEEIYPEDDKPPEISCRTGS